MSALRDSLAPPPLLLVGHGTRDPRGQEEFVETARKLAAALPRTRLVACCLELTPPTIDEGVDALAAAGARSFVVVPVLLFAGGHARQDIPGAVAAAVARHPGLTFTQAEHLGLQEDLLRLSAQRFAEARPVLGPARSAEPSAATASAMLAPAESASAADTFVVMIGRGGSDLDARDEMRRFVAARLQRTPVAGVAIGFLAGAGPDLNDALDAAEQSGLRRILVQPHLLYQGRLVRQVRQAVESRALRRPDLAWCLADHLGPADEVIYTLMGNYAG